MGSSFSSLEASSSHFNIGEDEEIKINISMEEIIAEINKIDKSWKSIENIICGLNMMIKAKLIDLDNIHEQFSYDNFKELKTEVKKYLKKNKKNANWVSFLNDIRHALDAVKKFDITNISLGEAIYILSNRKFGRTQNYSLTSIKLCNEIKGDIKHACLCSWMRTKVESISKSKIPIIKELDIFFNCNGALIKKINHGPAKRPKKSSPRPSYPSNWSEKCQLEIDTYINWRTKKTLSKKNFFYDLPIDSEKRRRIPKKPRDKVWGSDGESSCASKDTFLAMLQNINNFLHSTQYQSPDSFQFSDLFNSDLINQFVEWNINDEVFGSVDTYLAYIKTECNSTSYASIYCGSNKFKNRKKWVGNLELLYKEINAHRSEINELKGLCNKPKIGAKSNIIPLLTCNDTKKMINQISEQLWAYTKLDKPDFKKINSYQSAILWSTSIIRPLRAKNNMQLKWKGILEEDEINLLLNKSECSSIFKNKNTNVYWIFIPKRFLKNRRSKNVESILQPYNNLTAELDKYVNLSERFCNESDAVFENFFYLTRRDKIGSIASISTLYNRLTTGTKAATWDLFQNDNMVMLINPHATRHLIACEYLKDNPQDYMGLATLLMDDILTILKEYAQMDHRGNAERISKWSDTWNIAA